MDIRRDMKTSIYHLLMYSNPQALADLDSYQRKHYGVGIELLPADPDKLVKYPPEAGWGDDTDEIAREMEKAPASAKALADEPSRSRD